MFLFASTDGHFAWPGSAPEGGTWDIDDESTCCQGVAPLAGEYSSDTAVTRIFDLIVHSFPSPPAVCPAFLDTSCTPRFHGSVSDAIAFDTSQLAPVTAVKTAPGDRCSMRSPKPPSSSSNTTFASTNPEPYSKSAANNDADTLAELTLHHPRRPFGSTFYFSV